MIVIVDRHIYM